MSAPAYPHVAASNPQLRASVALLAASASCMCSLAIGAEERSQQGARTLEEVIVTAQKREERLENVPISITVLGGEALDTSTAESVNEVLRQVPGVTSTASFQGGGTQVTVRGVAAAGPLFFGANPVAYYLDSAPFGFVKSAIAPDSSAYDLERIEVLRGPQGTLYGSSALNGVMRILTRDANPDELEFKVRTSASTTQDGGENYRGDMAVNVPIVEGKLAARAVVGYQDFAGWIDKSSQQDFNDAQVGSYRLKVNARPTDKLSVELMGWRSRGDYGGPSQGREDRTNVFTAPEPLETDYDLYSGTLAYDFGSFSVTSATSLLDFDTGGDLDAGPIRLFTGLESEVFTEELTFNSATMGAWRWSLGAMYREAKDRTLQYLTTRQPGDPQIGTYEWRDRSESLALFGEVTRRLADGKFEVTAGLRYFEDDLRSQEGVPDVEPLLRVNPKFDATTPRFILTWHPGDHSTVYASYAEGFRSGFDQFLLAKQVLNFPPVQPDTLKNYELGTKGDVADGRFSYEAAVYYIDWQDVQQSLAFIVDGSPKAANMNGESASGLGVDVGVTMRPIDGLELGATMSWNDLSFDADVISAGMLLFAEGDRLNNSPEYTASLSVAYGFPIGGNGYVAHLSTGANYLSEQNFVTLLNVPYRTTGDTLVTGCASLALEAPARWTASLFVDNFTDESGTPMRDLYGIPDWSTRIRPRTVGLQLEYRF